MTSFFRNKVIIRGNSAGMLNEKKALFREANVPTEPATIPPAQKMVITSYGKDVSGKRKKLVAPQTEPDTKRAKSRKHFSPAKLSAESSFF
jgi:hypothetical protein